MTSGNDAITTPVNLLLLEADEVDAAGRAELTGRRASHVREVLRAAPGQLIRAALAGHEVGQARVLTVGSRVALELLQAKPVALAPPLIEVILALPRPKVLGRLISTLASFGVARIELINAWRVDKSYFGAAALAPATLREHARLGCEQGATSWVPHIKVHRLLMPFLRETLAQRLERRRGVAIIAHPRAPTIEALLPLGLAGPTVVAFGPEGGWIDAELESFGALGFHAASLGPFVLRLEIAAAAALAQLALLGRLP